MKRFNTQLRGIPVARSALTALFALFVLFLSASPVWAQQGPGPGGRRMMNADQRLAQLTTDLDLTDEQVEQLKPIIEKQTKKQQELFESADADRAQMRAEMTKLRDETDKAYAEVLSEEQMVKYMELRMQRMRRGRPPGNRR